MELEERILTYLRSSIAERGGQGRRISRIQFEMPGPYVDDEELVQAIHSLVRQRRVVLDHVAEFGWTYVVPVP